MIFSRSIAWIGQKLIITYYLKTPFFPISANLVVFCLSVTLLNQYGVGWGKFCTQNRTEIACVNGPLLNMLAHITAEYMSESFSIRLVSCSSYNLLSNDEVREWIWQKIKYDVRTGAWRISWQRPIRLCILSVTLGPFGRSCGVHTLLQGTCILTWKYSWDPPAVRVTPFRWFVPAYKM